tara:strand:+ start:326 stop:643 length:318 start_codon:yes stop_codon:yes gene_type:complete
VKNSKIIVALLATFLVDNHFHECEINISSHENGPSIVQNDVNSQEISSLEKECKNCILGNRLVFHSAKFDLNVICEDRLFLGSSLSLNLYDINHILNSRGPPTFC